MRLNVISDLHCEVNRDGSVDWMDFEPGRLEPADYLIVAGDTGYATTEAKIIEELKNHTAGKFKQVLTIKGNHSYWVPDWFKWSANEDELSDKMAPNDTIELVDEDVAIIGTTLWTNAVSYEEATRMNDYRRTPVFDVVEKLKRYEAESSWLRERYNYYKDLGKRIVVVTHHNPREFSVLPENCREHVDVMSAYWCFNCDETKPGYDTEIYKMSFRGFNHGLIRDVRDIKPEVWICGHIHENIDVVDNGIRFIRHPIGYRWGYYSIRGLSDDDKEKVTSSWYNCIIEI